MADFSPRLLRRHASTQLWLVNLVAGCVVGYAFLSHAPAASLQAWLFLRLGLVSAVAILTIAPCVLLWTVSTILPAPRAVGLVHALVWTAFLALLYLDTRIYNLFRYHLNGMVLNLVSTDGLGDSVQFSTSDWVFIATAITSLVAVQLLLYRWLLSKQTRRSPADRTQRWFTRPARLWAFVLLPIILIEKGLYASADLRRDRRVLVVARVLPGYMPLTVKGLFKDVFAYDLDNLPEVAISKGGLLLDYPLEPVSAPAEGPRPNFLIVVIDSLRPDVIEPETAPNLSRFAEGARSFADHLSNANSTRFGVFCLLYGIHGAYWDPFYAEKRSPVLVDVLLEAGYDFHVFSTTSMGSPEFRSTAWVRLEDDISDQLREGRGKAEGDAEAMRRLVDWVKGRGDRPYFTFAMLDSPHQKYSFPEEDAPFQPYLERWNYATLSDGDLEGETLELVRNSYRNAVHHVDDVVGRALDELEAEGLLENTFVIVTSDHAEELGECGFWGHTSNMTAAQVRVPFLLAGPGVEPGVESRPTSHLDVAPTLLELVGVDPALRGSYSLGGSLFAPDGGPLRVSAGWGVLGLWTDGGIVTVPLEAHGGMSDVYTYDWKLVYDDKEILRAARPDLVRLVRECARFLK